MKKILYLVTQSEFGGAQRYIIDLASNLSQKNYEITVAAGGKDLLFSKLAEKNIKYFCLKNLVREIDLWHDLLAYFEIKKLIKRIRPDIIHLNSSKAGVIGALAGHRLGVKKIIYTVHGFVLNEPMSAWKKKLYLWAERFSGRYKDVLICVSDFDRQVGIKYNIVPEKKLVTINNGIDKINFLEKNEARRYLGLPQDKIIIGTIANFYLTKGLSYFIQAAAIIYKILPEIKFTIIGDGQIRTELETLIKQHGLQNNFILTGAKPEAWKYLKAFDLYICSSVKEGFPFSIIEAMQAQLPIIATKVGGIPEIIQDNATGLLINPANQTELSEAIIKLINNKSLAEQLAGQAQLKALEKLSLRQMVDKTEATYQL